MPRALTSETKEAIFASETGQVMISLVTINHDDMPAPLRVCNNTEDVISNGETFVASAFDVDMPIQDGTSVPEMRVLLDNVDQRFTAAIRSALGFPTITLELVRAAAPDVVEQGPYELQLLNATIDHLVIEGQFGRPNLLNQTYPGETFNAENFPGQAS